MGKVIRLRDVIGEINSFEKLDTIYAREPWTTESDAIVVRDPDEGDPPEPGPLGLKYFLEVFITLEVIEGLMNNINYTPTLDQICETVIYYATYDAWPELND
jgi:hypothetical protein